MCSRAKSFEELRAYCETVPLVDCHDHTLTCGPFYEDPIRVITESYYRSDLISASSDAEVARIEDKSLTLEARWPCLERAWKRSCHTGYARQIRMVLKRFYGIEELSLDALRAMQAKPLDLRDPKAYEAVLAEANIAVSLQNLSFDLRAVRDPAFKLPPRSRFVISLPEYHSLASYDAVQSRVAQVGRRVTTLDEYIAACGEIFAGLKQCGAVAFKDQCAYTRPLEFGNPLRSEAEAVFNWFMEDPRRSAGYPDQTRPLDDYLFHEFMRQARELDLPVQIHTGHMAGIRNDIVKTNAVCLTSVLELHRDVRFDLFHANWPYDGEILFLCKNYPNVTMDFCWANIIDPVYCQDLFRRTLSCVPHGKVHGYGSDADRADCAWAHASIARDNVALALAGMVELDYLNLDASKTVARAWLFENANEFFRLGLKF